MKTKIIFSSVALMLMVGMLTAQSKRYLQLEEKAKNFESRINDVAAETKNIDSKTIEKLKQTLRTALVNYYKYAHLWDETQDGIVTQNSLNKFRDLFDDNTKIVSDISRYNGIVVPFENYASSVFDYMTAIGLDYEITSAVVDKIKLDKAGYYKAEVLITKMMYNGLSTDNSIYNCKSGRKFDLIFNYRIEGDNLDKAYVSNITGNLVKDCEDAKPMWGYFVGVDYGVVNGSVTDFFKKEITGLQIQKGASFGFNIGGHYFKPLTIKEKSFLKLGLAIQYRSLSATIDSSFYVIKNDSNFVFGGVSQELPISYDRRTNIEKKFNESHHTLAVSVPIGIHQKLFVNDDKTFRFSAEVCLTPSFLFFSKTSWSGRISNHGSRINFADGNYAILPINDSIGVRSIPYGMRNNIYFTDSDKSDVSSGNKVSKPDHVKLKPNFTLWASLSPNLEFIKGENKVFHISPILSYSILSVVKNNNSSKKVFAGTPTLNGGSQDRINNGTESSLIEDYFSSYNILSFGVNVGFIYKF